MLASNILVMGKKERTRAHLQEVALGLMVTRGFDQTTVEQIAEAAGVTSMTFFRHFQSKAEVLLDDPYDPVIGEAVAAQSTKLAPLERVVGGFREAWADLPEPDHERTRIRIRIVAGHPFLRAKMWESTLETQRVVVTALRSSGVPKLDAEIAAGACLGALNAALLDWGASGEGTLGERIQSVLNMLASDPAQTYPTQAYSAQPGPETLVGGGPTHA